VNKGKEALKNMKSLYTRDRGLRSLIGALDQINASDVVADLRISYAIQESGD
jgi:hypothetical protein